MNINHKTEFFKMIATLAMAAIMLLPVTQIAACATSPLVVLHEVSNTSAVTINDLADMLQKAYESEQEKAINEANSQEEAMVNILQIRARWQPIWKTMADLHAAHAAFLAAIHAADAAQALGQKVDLKGLLDEANALSGLYHQLSNMLQQMGISVPQIKLPNLGDIVPSVETPDGG